MIAFRFVNNFALAYFGALFYLVPLMIYGMAKLKSKDNPIQEGYASFERRAGAFLIDLLLIEGLSLSMQILFSEATDPPTVLVGLFILAVAFTNMVILPSQTGWSLGKRALGIQIVKKNDGRAGLFDIWYREIIKSWFSLSVLFLGCFWMLIGKNQLTWHDAVADTRVVNMDRKEERKPHGQDMQ